MSNAYDLEALIAALTDALGHARAAQMDVHFVSEINHLIATAIHNRDETSN